MKAKLILKPGETLQLIGSSSSGSLAETDIFTYSVTNNAGQVVGSVVHTDHTSTKAPFRRVQSVLQRDSTGAKIVDEHW